MSDTKLVPEIKTKWLAGLRSGEYKQGNGSLYNKTDSTYCCIGVLVKTCDITERSPFALGDGNLEKINLSKDAQELLVIMNDDELKPFCEIADWIEINL